MEEQLFFRVTKICVSQSDTDDPAQWEDHSVCDCSYTCYILKEIRWIEVPMWNEFGRTVVNRIRKILSIITFRLTSTYNGGLKDPTHEAIECHFQCKECQCNWWMTFEICWDGKIFRFGRYTVQYGTRMMYTPEKEDMYCVLIEEYNAMWEVYGLVSRNCSWWAGDFLTRIERYL